MDAFAGSEGAGVQAELLHKLNRAWELYGKALVQVRDGDALEWTALGGVRGEW